MLSRRNLVLRLSIILNVIVLCYVGTHFVSYSNVDMIEDVQATGRNLQIVDYNNNNNFNGQNSFQSMPDGKSFYSQTGKVSENPNVRNRETSETVATIRNANRTSEMQVSGAEEAAAAAAAAAKEPEMESVVMSIPGKYSRMKSLELDNPKTTQSASNASISYEGTSDSPKKKTLEEAIKCHDRDQKVRTAQRGDFWVLYNYVLPSRTFKCHETVTYTTHSDYTFLDNLEPLLDRWRGPISLALHAPGTDFETTLNAIQYLRKCGSDLVGEYVTFHVYFGSKFVPKKIPKPEQVSNLSVNCSEPPPWTNPAGKPSFRTVKKIFYPVNVGRNIARESAVTHYVLPSDIELYPSPGLIDDFLDMVLRQDPQLLRKNPKVFPIPIFELEANAVVPPNKTQLVRMLKSGRAIPFHKKVCSGCHTVPKFKEWVLASETKGLHVFHIGKRMGYFLHWEPIFIGTHEDPLYDERLTWEGKSDKMTQGYVLCVLDYEFHILDNAFLVHKPGIKTVKKDTARAILAAKTNSLIQKVILPELKALYGTKKGCAV